MARCYSASVRHRYPPRMPELWLISDARIDASLERAVGRLPRGSGLVFRHYHLPAPERRARFRRIARQARRRGHTVVLAGTVTEARRWRSEGAYGTAERLASGTAMLRLITVHSLREIGRAHRSRADAVLLSPVFATRSHPGAKTLGVVRFRLLARWPRVPVIALGGMDQAAARRLKVKRWAAIDGLAQPHARAFSIHS